VTYVRAAGWRQLHVNNDIALYQKGNNTGVRHQLLVPLSTKFADYDAAMRTVVTKLAASEGRDPAITALGLANRGADQVAVTAESAEPGAIPLDDASALFHGARGLILASASAAVSRRAAFGSARPVAAEQYLATVHARVLPGSFVVNLACPLAPPLSEIQPRSESRPYGREVTMALVTGLTAITTLRPESARSENDTQFFQLVEQGVSADLVDALAAFSPSASQEARHVTVNFTDTHPVDGERERNIEVPPGITRQLREVSQRLRQLIVPEPALMVGVVTSVERDRPGAPMTAKVSGTLTVSSSPGRRVTVRIDAPDLDEDLLVQSCRHHQTIEIHGEVLPRNRLSVVTSVSAMRLLPDDRR
jgi:hypothetical protein